MVVDFLFDPETWRIGVLSVLLDALDEAMRGGRRVLLVSPSADQAALWIASLSRLMPSSTARAVSFSVYERAARLASVWERGTLIASIPVEDLAALDEDDLARWIVVRDGETPALGQAGHSPHRTTLGSEIAPTDWSQLAQEVLLERETAEAALRELDDVAARVGDMGLPLLWPLAVAALRVDIGDGSLARAIAVSQLPGAALGDEVLLETLVAAAEAETGLGGSAATAWTALERLDPTTPAFVRDVATAGYLALALDDDSWLALPGGAPLPAEPVVAALAIRAVAVLERRLGDEVEPTVLLRLAETATRAGLLDAATDLAPSPALPAEPGGTPPAGDPAPASDGAAAIVDRAIARTLVPGLLVGAAEPLGAELPRLGDARVVHGPVFRAVDAHPSAARVPADALLSPAAVEWMLEHGPSPRLLDAIAATAVGDPAPVLALGASDRACLLRLADREGATSATVASAVLVRLATHGSWSADPELARITGRELWQAHPLLAIETAFPGALPAELLERPLACADASRELNDLALAVARRGTPTQEVVTAVARAWAQAATRSSIPAGNEQNVRTVVSRLVGRHDMLAMRVFGPLLVDAAITLATSDVAGEDWTVSELTALRASLATPELVEAALAVQTARSDAPDVALHRAAGLVAIAIVDAGSVPDVALPAQTVQLVDATDLDDVRLLDAVLDEVLPRVTSEPGLLASAVAEHLAEVSRSTGVERTVRSWLRSRPADSRPRATSTDAKTGSSARTDPKEN
nr:hypothetical protein [Pseudoclavibacter chungangensis]